LDPNGTDWLDKLGAHNEDENHPKRAETRPKSAETGPMLHEFWFEWLSFSPQLIPGQAVAIMAGTHHIQRLSE
jgi:hypothetical protein